MTKYSLVKETDPILQQPAEPWDWEKDGEVVELTQTMMKIMFENNGIGLSAPQIGINKQIFVMGNSEACYVCVNPEILDGTGLVKEQEGCLSFPGLWLHVSRYDLITVRYKDILGRDHEREFDGIMARVFQHEYDHLKGLCFVNKVSKLSLDLASKRRQKNLKRK